MLSHLRFRRGLQVAQTVAESLGCQTELAMLLLDGGHALEHHLVILPGERKDIKPLKKEKDHDFFFPQVLEVRRGLVLASPTGS